MTLPLMQHPLMAYTFVGVDSHKHSHTFVFVDCFSRELGTMTCSNIPRDFDCFLKEAKNKYLIQGTTFCFGLEDTTHYGRPLTRFLTDLNYLVKHVNSNLVASERNSSNTLNKSDHIDALSCARVLISRFDTLPIARINDDLFIFKSLVSRRKSMLKTNVSLKQQLHALISENYPSYQSYFPNIDTLHALAFFNAYPSAHLVKVSSIDQIAQLLNNATGEAMGLKKAQHKATRIYDSVINDQVHIPHHGQHRDFTICSIIRQLSTNITEIEIIESRLTEFLDILDIPLMSMNGIDLPLACGLIDAIGDIQRFKNAASLAKYAGIAPSTYASGNTHKEYANSRGNRALASLFYQLSVSLVMPRGKNNVIINPFFYDLYQRKRTEGKTHRQALKVVQRRLVNVIYGIFKHKHEYINPPKSYVVDNNTGEVTDLPNVPIIQSNTDKISATFKMT